MYARMDDLAAKVTTALDDTAEHDPQPSALPATGYPETLASGYYRVRKAWNDAKSQISTYCILSNAKEQTDKNHGYYVFSDDGVSIYPTATYREYTVQKGDPLWAIAHVCSAAELATQRSKRSMISPPTSSTAVRN